MLTKATEYAIRAMVAIELSQREGKRLGFKGIAQKIEAPEQFTAKVLQTLAKHDLVKSVRGRGGGFFFEKDAAPITLYDIIVVLEGKSFFHKCGFGFKRCDANNPCPLHDDFQGIRDAFYQLVVRHTITDLADKVSAGKAFLNRLELN